MNDDLTDRVRFRDDRIEFCDYPYPPASVYPNGVIGFESIKEADPDAAPPEIRTARGEVLFVPAALKESLRETAALNSIPCVSRIDVWDLILEPFVDTEFDREHQERTLSTLEANGISQQECMGIRASVAGAMHAYNIESGLWDWCHLGLSDVLDALQGKLSGDKYRLPPADFEAFYWRAMELAHKGAVVERQK